MTDWVMDQTCGSSTAKAVLLSLAYHFNEKTGLCNPSTRTIIGDTELNRKTVFSAIQKLEDLGFISVCRKDKTRSSYRFNLVPKTAPDDAQELVPKLGPDKQVKTNLVPKTGLESGTEIGTSKDREKSNLVPNSDSSGTEIGTRTRKNKEKNINNYPKHNSMDFSLWPGAPSEAVWDHWISTRKNHKAPVTDLVIKTMAKHMHELVEHGWTVDGILAECHTRNWQGLKASWLLENPGDNRNARSRPTSYAQRREDLHDAVTNPDRATQF